MTISIASIIILVLSAREVAESVVNLKRGSKDKAGDLLAVSVGSIVCLAAVILAVAGIISAVGGGNIHWKL